VSSEAAALLRRHLLLEYLTLAWSALSDFVATTSGIYAGWGALIGFGLDSVIEMFAGAGVVWQLQGVTDGRDRHALWLIGVTFLVLSGYVFARAFLAQLTDFRPQDSPVGIALTAGALVIMALLGVAKKRTGVKLGNTVLQTEAKVTLIDAGLAATLLVGLVLNATLRSWWADPLAALYLATLAVKEDLEALRGE
jgi:hypothetical protein